MLPAIQSPQKLTQIIFKNQQILPHIAKIMELATDSSSRGDLCELSTLAKLSVSKAFLEPNLSLKIKPDIIPNTSKIETIINNFFKQHDKFKWVGLSFGDEVAKNVQSSLQKISIQYTASETRFWGKIIGIKKDYYVIQGVKALKLGLQNIPAGSEKMGEGVNYYSFWVANNMDSQWQELPCITLEQMTASRNIKKLFTGQLDTVISSFPGREKHYLKAQLCRITHALEIVPKGIYKVNEENPRVIELEEEFSIPGYSELASIEGWVHKNPIILGLGRCSHYADPSLPEQEIERITGELAEKDPEVERLRGISEDKTGEFSKLGIENSWVIKTEGDQQVFGREQAQLVYGVVALRNIEWPGWVTIGFDNGYSSIYVGNGLKFSQPALTINQNQLLVEEAQEAQECSEPNPQEQLKPKEEEEDGQDQDQAD